MPVMPRVIIIGLIIIFFKARNGAVTKSTIFTATFHAFAVRFLTPVVILLRIGETLSIASSVILIFCPIILRMLCSLFSIRALNLSAAPAACSSPLLACCPACCPASPTFSIESAALSADWLMFSAAAAAVCPAAEASAPAVVAAAPACAYPAAADSAPAAALCIPALAPAAPLPICDNAADDAVPTLCAEAYNLVSSASSFDNPLL